MTACLIFLLSFNISSQDETGILIKPAFVNVVLAGVQVVNAMKVSPVSCKLSHYRAISVAYTK